MRVAILLEKYYEDPEFWYPYYRLKEEGIEVVAVAPHADQVYESKHGFPAKSDLASKEARAADFDGVIIPGGYSPDYMRRDPEMVRFVREMNGSGKVMAAICHGGWMLVSGGAVRGRRVTSFYSIRDDMENGGGKWVDEAVVVDHNLVTSRTPADLPAFMPAIIRALRAQT